MATARSAPPIRECCGWSTGSGMGAWRGPNRWGWTPGHKSQMSARAPGRSTRPISARPVVGSAQWCIDRVLTTRSKDRSERLARPRHRPETPAGGRPWCCDGRRWRGRSWPGPGRARSPPGRGGGPGGPTGGRARTRPTSRTRAPAGATAVMSAAMLLTRGPRRSRRLTPCGVGALCGGTSQGIQAGASVVAGRLVHPGHDRL